MIASFKVWFVSTSDSTICIHFAGVGDDIPNSWVIFSADQPSHLSALGLMATHLGGTARRCHEAKAARRSPWCGCRSWQKECGLDPLNIITAWWFGTWMDYFSENSSECHHPNGRTHIFFRGGWNHQPDYSCRPDEALQFCLLVCTPHWLYLKLYLHSHGP